MEKMYTIRCSNCNYTTHSSYCRDNGIREVLETYTCKSCNEVVDILTGEYGRTYYRGKVSTIVPDSAKAAKFYVCPQCGSGDHLRKWNKYKRPCPRCGVRMDMDSGEIPGMCD